MTTRKSPRKNVSFWATKKVPQRTGVSFRTKEGKRVSFVGTKKVPKRVKVDFWASAKGKSLKKR